MPETDARKRPDAPSRQIPRCDYCGGVIEHPRRGQRFCHGRCRSAYHHAKEETGTPARVASGPRVLKSGRCGVTLHLEEMPRLRPGDRVRVRITLEGGDGA